MIAKGPSGNASSLLGKQLPTLSGLSVGQVLIGNASGEFVLGASATAVLALPFGAKLDNLGFFAIASGRASRPDTSGGADSEQPMPASGTLTKLAYKTSSADATSTLKIHVNGVVQATVALTNVNAHNGGVETVSVAVSAGDYCEVEYDAGQAPDESTLIVLLEVT